MSDLTKEQFCIQELREAQHFSDDAPYLLELIEWAVKHIDKQARDLASYENAHKVLVAEREQLNERIDDLLGQLAEKVVAEQAPEVRT